MDKQLSFYKTLIEKKGYRYTSQKQSILEAIIHSDTHLSVKEIFEKVKHKNIGLATVYRSLKVFEDLGIVKEIITNGKSYYEIKIFSGKPLHIHFKCHKCDRIIDINDYTLDLEYLKLNSKIETKNNLEIHDANFMLVGLCSNCREDEKCLDQPNSGE